MKEREVRPQKITQLNRENGDEVGKTKNAQRAFREDARGRTLTDGGEEVEAVIWRRARATFSSRCIFSPACRAVCPNTLQRLA